MRLNARILPLSYFESVFNYGFNYAYDENRPVVASLVTVLYSASDRMLRPLIRSYLGPRPRKDDRAEKYSKWRLFWIKHSNTR